MLRTPERSWQSCDEGRSEGREGRGPQGRGDVGKRLFFFLNHHFGKGMTWLLGLLAKIKCGNGMAGERGRREGEDRRKGVGCDPMTPVDPNWFKSIEENEALQRSGKEKKPLTFPPPRNNPLKILEPENPSSACKSVCPIMGMDYSRNLLLWLINTYDGCQGWVRGGPGRGCLSKQISAGTVPPALPP